MPDFVIIFSENTDGSGWTWEVSHYRDYTDVRASGVAANPEGALEAALPQYKALDALPVLGDLGDDDDGADA